MLRLVDRMVAWSERLTELGTFRANAVIGALALVSHGGVLVLYLVGRADELAPWLPAVVGAVVVDAGLVSASVAGLRVERWEKPALRIGAIVMSGLAGMLLLGVTWWSVVGLPSEFAWTPGLFPLLVTYAGGLARRFLLPPHIGDAPGARNAHRFLVVCAMMGELGIVVRILMEMAS